MKASGTLKAIHPPVPHPPSIEKMLAVVTAKNWVADIGVTPQQFRNRGLRKNSIRYVGAYVAGSAIGDGRLVSQKEDRVTFRIFDYRTDQYTNLEMTKLEFVQAYARHILPAYMRRVRFVGLFRPKGRPARLEMCRALIQQVLAAAKPTANRHPPASDQAEEQTERELKQGVFCSKCQAKMQSNVEIEGPMTCWMLNVATLVMAWVIQHRLPALPLVCDADSIAEGLRSVVDRLQAEAWNRDQAKSLELGIVGARFYHTIVKGAAGLSTTVVINASVYRCASVSQLIKFTAMGVTATNDCTIRVAVPNHFTSAIIAG